MSHNKIPISSFITLCKLQIGLLITKYDGLFEVNYYVHDKLINFIKNIKLQITSLHLLIITIVFIAVFSHSIPTSFS